MKKQILTLAALALATSAQAAISFTGTTIDFDSVVEGFKANGWSTQGVSFENTSFSDTQESLYVGQLMTTGQELWNLIPEGSELTDVGGIYMVFDSLHNYFSIDVGADFGAAAAAVWLFNEGELVGFNSIGMTGDLEINQTLDAWLGNAGAYNQAAVYYVTAEMPEVTLDDAYANSYILVMQEAVDNLTFGNLQITEEAPVPEVQHYAGMLGAVLAGAEMLRRRRKA